MGQEETAVRGKNRIMIYGPKNGRHLHHRIQDGRGQVAGDFDPERRDGGAQVFPERMPYGLFVPDVDAAPSSSDEGKGRSAITGRPLAENILNRSKKCNARIG
jgi:hypothetical protein